MTNVVKWDGFLVGVLIETLAYINTCTVIAKTANNVTPRALVSCLRDLIYVELSVHIHFVTLLSEGQFGYLLMPDSRCERLQDVVWRS